MLINSLVSVFVSFNHLLFSLNRRQEGRNDLLCICKLHLLFSKCSAVMIMSDVERILIGNEKRSLPPEDGYIQVDDSLLPGSLLTSCHVFHVVVTSNHQETL
jgi:hypothetical protein